MRWPARGSSICWPPRRRPTSRSCSRRPMRPRFGSACARRPVPTRWRSPLCSGAVDTSARRAARCARPSPRPPASSSPSAIGSSTARMLGVVNLDKPVGPTSHDMVGLLRRLTGTRRIGHAGTLDPLASGVLPILVGAATRFSEELTGGRKRYDALIRPGIASVTGAAQGPLTPGNGPLPDRAALEEALAGFVGTFEQRHPAFSARKAQGRVAHRAARAGEQLDLPTRQVTVERLALLELRPGEGWLDVRVDIRCGPGTYVRSIARDLGERLGCGGHLHALRRTEAAGLVAEDALPPERLEALAAGGRLAEALIPVADLLPLPRLALAEADARRFVNGSAGRVGPHDADGRRAGFSADELLGIGRLEAGLLQPEKVVASTSMDSGS